MVISLRTFLVASASLSVLMGCDANFHSIHRSDSFSSPSDKKIGEIIYTDAKQGATIVSIDEKNTFRACAARSPDVFSALSTAFSGELEASAAEKFAGALSGSGSTAENASAFGLRTQLTQSQMELLYQLCINALNGKLTDRQLATELHRYQNTMVTMLAIEQLTGYARPTIVTLGTAAATGSADQILALQKMVNEATAADQNAKANAADKKKKSEEATGKLTAAQTALKNAVDASKPEIELAPLRKAVTDAEGPAAAAKASADATDIAAKNAASVLARVQASLDAAIANPVTSASSGPTSVTQPTPTVLTTDANTAEKISHAIVVMQQTHLSQTFVADTCLQNLLPEDPDKLSQALNAIYADGSIGKMCINYLTELTKYKEEELRLRFGCDIDGKNCTLPTDTTSLQPMISPLVKD